MTAGGAAFGIASDRIRIDVWSDIACPFCYMGTTALKQAIRDSGHADEVDVLYHSFELAPQVAGRYDGSVHEFLAEEQGVSVEQARAMNRQLEQRAATLGLEYRNDILIVANTRAAHRLIHLALSKGIQRELIERLFAAQFAEGRDVSDHEVLAGLATDVGIDRAEAAEVLASGAYEESVAADIARARALGVQGVPFFVLDDRYALSGAQPVETFRRALAQLRDEKTGTRR